MKFKIKVKDETGREWTEEYEKDYIHSFDEAVRWSRGIVECFNKTLKDGETPRELLGVETVSS